jgi:hypothetical protein
VTTPDGSGLTPGETRPQTECGLAYTRKRREGGSVRLNHRPSGALIPVAVAADLAGLPVCAIETWLADGLVYSERVRNKTYVDLGGVERLANQDSGRGSE